MSNSQFITDQMLDAVETIINYKLDTAHFDRTIKGNIVQCLDSSIGKYQIKYLDSYFEAYSRDTNKIFTDEALVQILIPQNDMTQKKIILDYAQEDYLDADGTAIELEDYYDSLTGNLIISNQEYSLSSYHTEQIILYDKTNNINTIQFNDLDFQNGLEEANGFTLAANFKNQLDQMPGNFGVGIKINYIQNLDGDINTQTYLLDTNGMIGNPYALSNYTYESKIFDLSSMLSKYDSIEQIYLFVSDFPTQISGKDPDIFIKDLELYTVKELTEEQLKQYSIEISKDKNYFEENDLDTDIINVLAKLKRNKNIINTDSNKYQFYWFKQNAAIDSDDNAYSIWGGNGWECLNSYNILDSTTGEREYVTNINTLTTIKSDNVAFQNNYKVIIVANNKILATQFFYIYNKAVDNNLSIQSSEGSHFYYNNGNPTLTMLQNGMAIETPGVWYTWCWEDNNGNSMVLDNHTSVLLNLDLSDMEPNGYWDYSCDVYRTDNNNEDVHLGGAKIRLFNHTGEDILAQYKLEIIDKHKTFNYNTFGIAPNNGSLEKPITLEPLKFQLIDAGGKIVKDDIINSQCSAIWTPPTSNTLIVGDIANTLDYTYNLEPKYNPKKIYNNVINLAVEYEGYSYTDSAVFSFVKDGEPGTNGSDIICKIVPNINDSTILNEYPMIVNTTYPMVNPDYKLNYTPAVNNKWFKAQLWQNGQIIWEGYQSDANVTLDWSILKTEANEDSNIIITDNNFSFDTNIELNDTDSANIVKATIKYQDLYYFGTLPILTCIRMGNYSINLIKDTGYRYVVYTSAGKNPQYDNSIPFQMEAYDGTEEITNLVTYNWSTNSNNLIIKNSNNHTAEQNSIVPIELYIGDSINNAILVTVLDNNNNVIGILRIPIHMYLNKYSLAAINNWDGNSITLDEDEGAILAPQVGAGSKDANNRFTGVLMGAVKEAGAANIEQGLFGYNEGQRTIFLDAATGKAEFGNAGSGQIIIDPTQNKKALIYGGNYISGTSGMLIDLTTPEIKWGNNNFAVNSSGQIRAVSGLIGGWTVSAKDLTNTTSTYKVGMYNGDNQYNDFLVVHNLTNNTAPFYVHTDGYLYANNANIKGTITAASGTIGGWTIGSTTISQTHGDYTVTLANYDNDNANSRILHCATNGTDTFSVTRAGKLTCNNVDIKGSINSGSTITGSTISGGSITINGNNFKVNSSGQLTMYNGVGYISMLHSSNHPWMSGINVNGLNGVNLYTGTDYDGSLGTKIGNIAFPEGTSNQMLIQSLASRNLNIKSAANMALTSSDSYVRINNFYFYTSETDLRTNKGYVGLEATGGSYCWATRDGTDGKITTDNGTLSSRNLKTNFEKFTETEYQKAYKLLQNIDLYNYDYKYKIEEKKHQYGFIIDDLEQQDGVNEFFHFFDEVAKIDNQTDYFQWLDPKEYENLDINNLPKDYLHFKRYDERIFTKYLLTCIKALQYKIDDLERRLK